MSVTRPQRSAGISSPGFDSPEASPVEERVVAWLRKEAPDQPQRWQELQALANSELATFPQSTVRADAVQHALQVVREDLQQNGPHTPYFSLERRETTALAAVVYAAQARLSQGSWSEDAQAQIQSMAKHLKMDAPASASQAPSSVPENDFEPA